MANGVNLEAFTENGKSNFKRQCQYVRPVQFGLLSGEEKQAAVAGIRYTEKKIEIRPTISGQLAHARAEYNSPKGKIISAWKWEGEKVAVSITIPCNAEAVVTLPGREPEKLAFCC